MSLGHGADIPRSGLKFTTDVNNIKSYSGSGSSWKNIIDGYQSTGGISTPSNFNDPSWSDGMTALTAICAVSVIGSDTTYAYHPLNKWTGTTDAAFVLYHFQNFQGTNPGSANLFTWYANRGGIWGAISAGHTCFAGSTYLIGVQYNSTSGGQMWVNGVKRGSRNGSGVLGTNATTINIDGGPEARTGIHNTKAVWIYDRELSDDEMLAHFNAQRARYDI
jgi:hypothetical protein